MRTASALAASPPYVAGSNGPPLFTARSMCSYVAPSSWMTSMPRSAMPSSWVRMSAVACGWMMSTSSFSIAWTAAVGSPMIE